jgi:hypothetical protein
MADHFKKFSDRSNGEQWFFLGTDEADGYSRTRYVLHKANVPSEGMETRYEIGAFLATPHTPEAQDLLVLGALVRGTDEFRGAHVQRRDDEARL